MKGLKEVSSNKQSFWLAFGRILALLFSMSIPLVLTRILDKDEYGFYSQFNTVIYFLASFFSFGMFHNLFFYYPIAKEIEKKPIIIQTFLYLFLASLFSALVIFIPQLNSIFIGNDLLLSFKWTIFFLTIILVVTDIMPPLYIVRRDVNVSKWFPAVQIAIKVIFIFTLFAFVPSINSLVLAIVISSILVLAIIIIYIKNSLKRLPKGPFFNKKMAKKQLIYNLPMALASGFSSLSQKFDKIITISFLSASSYATYSIAFFGVPGIQQIYESISQVAIVDMTKKFDLGDKKSALVIYKNMVVKTLSFSVPIIMIVAFYAQKIITILFTEKYRDATPLFQMYLISFIFVMLGAGIILRASDNTNYIKNAFIYSSIITVPATYLLVKYYGIFGGMYGALISIILPKLYMLRKEVEIMDTGISNFLPWKKISLIFMVSFLSIIPLIIFNFFSPIDNIFLTIILSIVYLFVVSYIEVKLNIFIVRRAEIDKIFKKYLKI